MVAPTLDVPSVPSPTVTPPPPSYATPAWLVAGLRAVPGVLSLHEGRLAFATDGGVVFDEAVGARLAVTFPRRYGGGGVAVLVAGTRHRLSLVRPHRAPEPVADQPVAAAPGPWCSRADVAAGRRTGRVLRTLLGATRA